MGATLGEADDPGAISVYDSLQIPERVQQRVMQFEESAVYHASERPQYRMACVGGI